MHDEIYHRDLVRALLVFVRDTHNPQYAEFDLSERTLDSCPNLAAIPQLAVHPSTYKHDKTQQPQQSSSTVVGSAINCKDRDGNVAPPLATIRVRAETKADVTPNQFLNFPGGVYAIKPSTDYLNTNTLAWITTCFPRQFPFGRGGPDEGRSRKISDKALLNHYLRVSSGVFQDYECCLHAYDYLSRKNTRGQAGV